MIRALKALNSFVPKFSFSGNRAPWDDFWYQPVLSSMPTASQVTVNENTAYTYSAVWAATRLLCGTGSRLPLKLWKLEQGELGETRKHLRDHPVQRLLKRPNPEMSGLAFRAVLWQWQVNWGNAYAEIMWGRNDEPVELWPLKPWLMTVTRDSQNGRLRYEYRDEMRNHESRLISPENVLHIPSVITGDGIVGKGVIEAARETVGFGLATERHGASWFGNGAVPRIIVENAGPKFDDTQRRNFRKEWNEIYGGPTGEKVAVLGGDATVKPLTISQEDSQFLQTRQHNVEEIARWYGVPPHMLQHLLRATFNNIEEMGIDFVRYTLAPWMANWQEAIEFKLLPNDDEEDNLQVEHDTMAIELGNSTSRAEFIKSMTSSAVMTRNEGRRMVQLDPVPGGDTFVVQGAMVPLDDDGKPESDFAGNAGGDVPMMEEPDGDAGDTYDPDAMEAEVLRAARSSLANILSRVNDIAGDRAVGASKKPDTFIDWLDGFFAEHESHVKSAIADSCKICSILGIRCDSETVASEWVRTGHAALLSATDCQPGELASSVSRCVSSREWKSRPTTAVLELGT